MLVDMVRLRYRGEKLPKDRIAEVVPMRGEVEIGVRDCREPWSPNTPTVKALCALLTVDDGGIKMLHTLRDARVNRWIGAEVVVIGLEDERAPGGAMWTAYPQAWWCRLVLT